MTFAEFVAAVDTRLRTYGLLAVPAQESGDQRRGWSRPNKDLYAWVIDFPDRPFRVALAFVTIGRDRIATYVTPDVDPDAYFTLALGDGEARSAALAILERFAIEFDPDAIP